MRNKKFFPKFYSLSIRDLVLWIHLGRSIEERMKPQEVRVQANFRFRKMPLGSVTDDLRDTICYEEVTALVQKTCETAEYALIERLGLDIYKACKKCAGAKAQVSISVCKVNPPLERLVGGSHFQCGDFFL